MCNLQRFSNVFRPVLAGAICVMLSTSALAVDHNSKVDGYRGIWFSIGQANEYGPKYSGGLGTYTANHVPICIYAEQVNKTFFAYGGVDSATGDLLIMASYYDHENCLVPRPTVVHHKVGINDPHDNGALLIDRDGYLWIFISGRGASRTGWIYRSTAPYSVDAFEWKRGGTGAEFFEKTYPQPWYMDNGVDAPVFLYMFTKYTKGRELYWSTSPDGVTWAPDQKLAGTGGHYQTSCMWQGRRVGTAFNHHPNGSVDRRTNLYYLQTDDLGQTWTQADGTPVSVPLNDKHNPALLVDYEAQGLLCYINDTNFDAQGNPYIIYETSGYYAAGPDSGPRVWRLARWDGQQWIYSDITESTHNYDMGSLWVEGSLLRIMGPTEPGPQYWGTGGEVALWTSTDLGATWTKQRDVTSDSVFNHSYVRRPLNGRDPFFAMWADGHALQKSDSSLYFCNRAGTHVWRLPRNMAGDFARPARVTDFGSMGGEPLWRSRFETVGAGPVAHAEPVGTVRNAAGAPGAAVGSTTIAYAGYGQPGVGGAPVANAGAYAAALPDDRGTGINTTMRSDAGNLNNALTAEGFFRTPEAVLINSPTFVGRRLISQKRGTSDDSSRLAIGLHAGVAGGGGGGLFDYEGFDYSGTTLEGRSGGMGWGGAWTNATTFAHLSNDGVSLPALSPLVSVGSRISGSGGTAARPLSRPIDLSADGVTYLSALMRKTSTSATSSANLEVGLATSATIAGTSSTVRVGMTSGSQFFLTNSGAPTGTVTAGTTYLVLVKIVSSAAGSDQCFMNFYPQGQAIPATEPATWALTHSLNSSALLTHLRTTIGANLVKGEIDEIRVGNTYASVTDPNAPIATGGGAANLLSIFWHDTNAVNYLVSGVTAIQPNTWYHFALVYDGADIKWYLDGNLEGQVAAVNLVPAGSGAIAIGNNRLSGTADRGFYGTIDEIRISDQALSPAQFLINGGSCDGSCGASGSVLWCSGFEAAPNTPVVHQQIESGICGAVENVHGAPGTATGSSNLTYVQYGQPGVGQAAGDEAGGFALAMPGDRSAAVDSNLRSNTARLDQDLTFEGFFNSAEAAPILSPDSVGRRLVTQRRDLATDTRLAVGLHAHGAGNVLSVVYKRENNATFTAFGTTPIETGRWYHFAVTYNGEAIRWYLDGRPEGAVAVADLIEPGNASIVLGNRRADGVADRGFHGMIDEIRIHDRALTPAQFLVATGSELEEPCLPGCPWPFADADGDGDVDQTDFGLFQACFTTSGELLPLPLCHCFDRAGDATIDLLDLEEFMNCATGPAVLWNQELTPGCIP